MVRSQVMFTSKSSSFKILGIFLSCLPLRKTFLVNGPVLRTIEKWSSQGFGNWSIELHPKPRHTRPLPPWPPQSLASTTLTHTPSPPPIHPHQPPDPYQPLAEFCVVLVTIPWAGPLSLRWLSHIEWSNPLELMRLTFKLITRSGRSLYYPI